MYLACIHIYSSDAHDRFTVVMQETKPRQGCTCTQDKRREEDAVCTYLVVRTDDVRSDGRDPSVTYSLQTNRLSQYAIRAVLSAVRQNEVIDNVQRVVGIRR